MSEKNDKESNKNDKESKKNDEAKDQDNSNGGDKGNLFDIESLRLSQGFHESAGVKKIITTVPIRKPNRHEFVRTHPDKDYRLETAVLELKEERETYVVNSSLWQELPGEIKPTLLMTTISRQNVLTIWPIKLPDGRINAWHESAIQAAKLAESKWIRVAANMSMGAYDLYEASADIPDPVWPEISFQNILELAFKDYFIKDINHPVLNRLRGEV